MNRYVEKKTMKPLPSGEKNTMSKSLCWSTRAIAYCAMFSVFMQPLPVLSASFSDGYIQDQLNSFALFERSSASDYQFQAVDYINEPVQAPSMDIDAFHDAMKQQYKHALEPKYVPIKVGNTHTVVPIYPETKKVGTSLLQNRYIRSQIHSLLGRSLIDAELYTNENQQIDTLYQNALNYTLNAPALRYGDRLPMSQSGSGLAQDMIWPEIREINGESVVVPVVYLSDNTVNRQKVTTNVTELNGSVSLAALRIDDVDVHLGREAFLNVASDLTNYRGSIVSSGNLTLVAGGTLRNLSGDIKANGNITIGAHSIENRTIIYRHTERNVGFSGGAHESGTRYAQIAGINAIDGSVTLNSMSNISFLGGQASAGSELTLSADGDIYIEGLQLNNQYTEQQGGVSLSRSDTTYLQSSLSSKDTLRLIAGGEIVITASELISDEGHIQLLAELGITVLDGKQEHRQNRTGTYRSRDINESVYQTVAVRSILDAGLGVRMHSAFGDITLRGSEISSSQGASVTAENGGIKLLLTKELDHYSYSSIDKGLFTIKTENRGHEIETAVHNTIVGGLQVSATGGVYVEYEGDSELTMQEQIANIGEFEGMEWMADFYAENQYNPNIDWQEIETTYKEWNESSTSISPALAAVIAIAVAVATGGAAAGLVGSMVSNSVAAAAITAGSVSLLSQATVALANGAVNRDVSGAMEDFASSDTLRSVAITMVTAGAMNAINTQFFTAGNLGASSSFTEEVTSQVTNSATGVTTTVTELNLTLGAQALQAVTSSVVNAGVRTAIDGGSLGDSLVDSLIQNSVNFIGQRMTNAISDAAANGDIDKAIEYIAHAGSGCVLGAISAGQSDDEADEGCASGSLGALSSVVVTDIYNHSNRERIANLYEEEQGYFESLRLQGFSDEYINTVASSSRNVARLELSKLHKNGVDLARLSGAFSGFLAGLDVNASYQAGSNVSLASSRNSIISLTSALEMFRDNNSEIYLHGERLGHMHLGNASGTSMMDQSDKAIKGMTLVLEAKDILLDELAELAEQARLDGHVERADKLLEYWVALIKSDLYFEESFDNINPDEINFMRGNPFPDDAESDIAMASSRFYPVRSNSQHDEDGKGIITAVGAREPGVLFNTEAVVDVYDDGSPADTRYGYHVDMPPGIEGVKYLLVHELAHTLPANAFYDPADRSPTSNVHDLIIPHDARETLADDILVDLYYMIISPDDNVE